MCNFQTLEYNQAHEMEVSFVEMIKNALAGSRTRVNCLGGNYSNHYTTKAMCNFITLKYYQAHEMKVSLVEMIKKCVCRESNRVNCLEGNYFNQLYHQRHV